MIRYIAEVLINGIVEFPNTGGRANYSLRIGQPVFHDRTVLETGVFESQEGTIFAELRLFCSAFHNLIATLLLPSLEPRRIHQKKTLGVSAKMHAYVR